MKLEELIEEFTGMDVEVTETNGITVIKIDASPKDDHFSQEIDHSSSKVARSSSKPKEKTKKHTYTKDELVNITINMFIGGVPNGTKDEQKHLIKKAASSFAYMIGTIDTALDALTNYVSKEEAYSIINDALNKVMEITTGITGIEDYELVVIPKSECSRVN